VVFSLDAMLEIFAGDEFAHDQIRPPLSESWRAAHGQLTQVYRERVGTGPVVDGTDGDLAQGKTMSYECREARTVAKQSAHFSTKHATSQSSFSTSSSSAATPHTTAPVTAETAWVGPTGALLPTRNTPSER
jgi:hypothetical protein